MQLKAHPPRLPATSLGTLEDEGDRAVRVGESQTTNPTPKTLDLKTQTPNPETRNPKPKTQSPEPHNLDLKPKPQTPNPKTRTPIPNPQSPIPKPQTPNPNPQALFQPWNTKTLEPHTRFERAPLTVGTALSGTHGCSAPGRARRLVMQKANASVVVILVHNL